MLLCPVGVSVVQMYRVSHLLSRRRHDADTAAAACYYHNPHLMMLPGPLPKERRVVKCFILHLTRLRLTCKHSEYAY